MTSLATELLLPFSAGLAVLVGTATLLWLLSLRLEDVSIVDIYWGLAFVAATWIYRGMGPPAEPRQVLLLLLVTVWGVRLGGHIYWRGRGRAEDYRYAAMRDRHGDGFRVRSLLTVFWLQAVLAALISAPLLVTQARVVGAGWRWSDLVGVVLWGVGFFFEAVGDRQLLRFQADSDNRGRVLDSGLWAWTRHPNYFGESVLWWGYWLIALGAPGGAWTLPAPLLMTFLLLRVSGVSLLEKTIADRRPGYRAYAERTNAFFPGPPRRPGY